jgi:RES domain-containing protein
LAVFGGEQLGWGFTIKQTIGKYAVLKVPGVVVRGEFNFILNPMHNDFKKIKIINTGPFPFDLRLLNG